MIYLASPYTHEYPEVMEQRYEQALAASRGLQSQSSEAVFSPVVYGHHLLNQLPSSDPTVRIVCHDMLEKADKVVVLKIEGWDTSSGVKDEIRAAEARGIPVTYLDSVTEGAAPLGSRWRHKKSGEIVKVVGNAEGQSWSGLPWNNNWEILIEYINETNWQVANLPFTVKQLLENFTKESDDVGVKEKESPGGEDRRRDPGDSDRNEAGVSEAGDRGPGGS